MFQNQPYLPIVQNDFKISTDIGKYRVINSGVVHSTGVPITLNIEGVLFEIVFYNDPTNVARINYFVINEQNKLQAQLYNFNSPTGYGVYEPVKIAVTKGGDVFITFVVISPHPQHYQVTYSLLVESTV